MSSDAFPAMPCDWVVGRFEGNRAKSVMDHAGAGIGYIILEQGGGMGSRWCLATFRRACDSPVPPHLTVVTDPSKIAKYEKIREAR